MEYNKKKGQRVSLNKYISILIYTDCENRIHTRHGVNENMFPIWEESQTKFCYDVEAKVGKQ